MSDLLFVLAELAHLCGIGILFLKLNHKKSAAGDLILFDGLKPRSDNRVVDQFPRLVTANARTHSDVLGS